MKKTLVALAALAATGAFAQNVGFAGAVDVGYKSTTDQAAGKNSQGIGSNNVTTTQFDFVGTEDLGGGMKASFFYELDFNPVQSSSADGATGATQAFVGTPFTGQQYVGLEGGFGSIKLGAPNSGFFGVATSVQPLGTGMGSGYSAGFGRLGTVSGLGISQFLGAASSSGRVIRHEKSVSYATPNMSGFSAQGEYAFQNDNSSTTASNSEAFYSIALSYSNGPLYLGYATATAKVGSLGTASAWTAIGTPTNSTANSDVTYSVLGGSYAFGKATAYAGFTRSSSNGMATNEDATSWSLGAKYAVNATVDVIGNYTARNTSVLGANPAKNWGGGADYKLSKRTNLYLRYEYTDTNTNDSAAGEVTAWAVGVKHSF